MRHAPSFPRGLLAAGFAAVVVACLSILDMFLPRPHDGVILHVDRGELRVRGVVEGSGAAQAGIRPGDRIVGVARAIVPSPSAVEGRLRQRRIGEVVPYLVEREGQLLELEVRLSPRRLGSPLYVVACLVGFLFFAVGLYVLLQRASDPPGSGSRVFFVVCTLFLLFLVCRLRPASYSWVDGVVLTTGTLALLALPAAFLHFFLVFPRRQRFSLGGEADSSRLPGRLSKFVNESPHFFTVLYLLPPLTYAVTTLGASLWGWKVRMVFGAPLASWVLLGDYMVLGVAALLRSARLAASGPEKQQIGVILTGTALGVVPFLFLAVALPSFVPAENTALLGVIPLMAVPLTFAYAIVRFQFFDIRVVVRRSLLYTLTTAALTTLYALLLAAFNALSRSQALGQSRYFPVLFALVVVALFDPLRRRLQGPIDRFFFRDLVDGQRAVEELADALAREFSLARLEQWLTERLAEVMKLEWVALYRREKDGFRAAHTPPGFPQEVGEASLLLGALRRLEGPARLGELEPLGELAPSLGGFLSALAATQAKLLVPLATEREVHALLVVGPKRSEEEFSRGELQLLRTLANQGALGYENAHLYQEHTRQVELEKELEIARTVQFSLIPRTLTAPAPWRVAARCVPARQVGGDFYDALPAPRVGCAAFVLGDVAGKSVPGAMLMVAAREALHAGALAESQPEQLLAFVNRRLYHRERRMFLALSYLLLCPQGRFQYALAGQPAPWLLRRDGSVEELPLPEGRLPLGGLERASWQLGEGVLQPGELLLLFSDGLPEARDPQGEPLGEEGLRRMVASLPRTPEEALEVLLRQLERYRGEAKASDDVTVMAVAWEGTR